MAIIRRSLSDDCYHVQAYQVSMPVASIGLSHYRMNEPSRMKISGLCSQPMCRRAMKNRKWFVEELCWWLWTSDVTMCRRHYKQRSAES